MQATIEDAPNPQEAYAEKDIDRGLKCILHNSCKVYSSETRLPTTEGKHRYRM